MEVDELPNRILKESICTSKTIDALLWEEEVFFYRLMTACDDYGRFDGRPSVIRGKCFPLRLDWVKDDKVAVWLDRLEEVRLIARYEVGEEVYLQMLTWRKHQQVRASKSKYPNPPDDVCNQLISDEINRKQMSPYSYSESYSITEPESVADKITDAQRLWSWLSTDCDKALSTPVLRTRWDRYLGEGFTVEAIQLAVEEAALNGAGNKPNYIFSVLNNWRSQQAFTPDAIDDIRGKKPATKSDTPQPSRTYPSGPSEIAKLRKAMREKGEFDNVQ